MATPPASAAFCTSTGRRRPSESAALAMKVATVEPKSARYVLVRASSAAAVPFVLCVTRFKQRNHRLVSPMLKPVQTDMHRLDIHGKPFKLVLTHKRIGLTNKGNPVRPGSNAGD